MKTILFQGQFKSKIIMLVVIISLSFLSPAAQVNASTSKLADPFFPFAEEPSFLKKTAFNNNDTPPEGFQNIDSSRIETFTMNMPQLDGREKDIIVYLPTDYFSSDRSYPVVYLQNAEEVFVFDRNEDGNGSWILNETLYTFFTANFESEVIIVGAVSDPIFIWEEYGPWVNENMYLWMDPYEANRVEGGQGDAYLDFLIQTLKPEIDIRYRTLPGRENTSIGGYDMGGLLSLYAGLTRSEVYSRVIALSPAIWFAEKGGPWLSNNQLLVLINNHSVPKNVNFSIDIAKADKSTDLEVRPAVNNIQGEKISFPQAYIEGAQALLLTMLDNGLPRTNLKHENIDINVRSEELFEPSISETTSDNIYYLPLVMKQGLDTFTLSMEPYLPGRGNRRIWVYLPPDYQKSLDSYPVIYLTSAQHIFGSETGANITELTDWKFDEKLDWIYNTYGRGIIAVAVEYDAHYPWDEYSAWDNDYMYDWIRLNQNFDGKADALLRFIVEELKPTIDKRYRTLSEGENTAIGGGSRHALFALYAGLERPDVFSRIMAMSPAIWVANNSRTWLKNNGFINWFGVNSAPGDVRYYLYVGTKEWSTHTPPDITQDYTWDYVYLDGVNKTKSKLISDGVPDQNIYKDVNIGGDHYPEVWSHYVDDALEDLGFFP